MTECNLCSGLTTPNPDCLYCDGSGVIKEAKPTYVSGMRAKEAFALLAMTAMTGPAMPRRERVKPNLRKRRRLRQSKNSPCECGSGKKFKKCCMKDVL